MRMNRVGENGFLGVNSPKWFCCAVMVLSVAFGDCFLRNSAARNLNYFSEAEAAYAAGNYYLALSQAEKGKVAARQTNTPASLYKFCFIAGNSLRQLGQREEALKNINEATTLILATGGRGFARKPNRFDPKPGVPPRNYCINLPPLLMKASLLREMGKISEAKTVLAKGREFAQMPGDEEPGSGTSRAQWEAAILASTGMVLEAEGDVPGAIRLYDESLNKAGTMDAEPDCYELGDPVDKRSSIMGLRAAAQFKAGLYADSANSWREVYRSVDSAETQREAYNLDSSDTTETVIAHWAVSLLAASEPGKAAELASAARPGFRRSRRISGLSAGQSVSRDLAVVRAECGPPTGALEAVESGRARRLAALLASRDFAPSGASGKFERLQDAWMEVAELRQDTIADLADPVGGKSRSALVAEFHEGQRRIDREVAALAEEIAAERPELALMVGSKDFDTRALQNCIPDGLTVIEYYHPGEYVVGGARKEELWAFVIDKSRVELKRVPLSRAKLDATVNSLYGAVAKPVGDVDRVTSMSADLLSLLFDAVKPSIKNRELCIVPTGVLGKLPFNALVGISSDPWIRDREISVIPSAWVASLVFRRAHPALKSILAVGNPQTSLAALPNAEEEVRLASKLFAASECLTGKQATETAFKKLSLREAKPSVVHLACHGVFNPVIPLLSHLSLTPTADDDGRLELHEIHELDLRGVSLVTLSACSTGPGDIGPDDDPVGIVRGFLVAGASSTLCTLWEVDDEATAALMREFYKALLAGRSKSEALHSAQEAVRCSTQRPEWKHPYYWGAFVLYGTN